MASDPGPRRWTFEEYFAWEAEQTTRHEFVRGEIFAITGGSLRHSRVIVRLLSELDRSLAGGPCALIQGDAKLRIEAADVSAYPDAFVVCDPAVMQERGVVTDAIAIFEVLSPSTVGYDLSEKFTAYQMLPSLCHYIALDPEALVAQEFARVDGKWTVVPPRPDRLVTLDALGIDLSLDRLFDGVGPPRKPVARPIAIAD